MILDFDPIERIRPLGYIHKAETRSDGTICHLTVTHPTHGFSGIAYEVPARGSSPLRWNFACVSLGRIVFEDSDASLDIAMTRLQDSILHYNHRNIS